MMPDYCQPPFARAASRSVWRASSVRAAFAWRAGVDYLDLGPDDLRGADKTKSVNRLLRKIENLGFEVTGIREKQAA